jgi:type I restriction enzyme M protein
MVAVLNRRGRMAVVVPHGVLFRSGAEREIRKRLIEEDLIEVVIGLAANLFYGTPIPAAVLVLNRSKDSVQREKVLIVDASREYEEGNSQNWLRDSDVAKIATAVRTFADSHGIAKVVSSGSIAETGFSLNIGRYIEAAPALGTVDLKMALSRLRQAEEARDLARVRMTTLLTELGYDS